MTGYHWGNTWAMIYVTTLKSEPNASSIISFRYKKSCKYYFKGGKLNKWTQLFNFSYFTKILDSKFDCRIRIDFLLMRCAFSDLELMKIIPWSFGRKLLLRKPLWAVASQKLHSNPKEDHEIKSFSTGMPLKTEHFLHRNCGLAFPPSRLFQDISRHFKTASRHFLPSEASPLVAYSSKPYTACLLWERY